MYLINMVTNIIDCYLIRMTQHQTNSQNTVADIVQIISAYR